MPYLIAIDGPVGAGKSTISDEVAKRLHILHLDTGAMYRAAGLCAVKAGVDLNDENAVSETVQAADISVTYTDGTQQTLLNGEDVSGQIRTQAAGQAASAVSRYPAVRKKLVAEQRKIGETMSMLVDGRDIGTVVFPNATVKLYLTASNEARATRRMLQLREKGDNTPFEEILAEVIARDEQDMNRKVDPLRKAEDAILVDSTEIDFEQTVTAMLNIIKEKVQNV